jgi:hypothetical protein
MRNVSKYHVGTVQQVRTMYLPYVLGEEKNFQNCSLSSRCYVTNVDSYKCLRVSRMCGRHVIIRCSTRIKLPEQSCLILYILSNEALRYKRHSDPTKF